MKKYVSMLAVAGVLGIFGMGSVSQAAQFYTENFDSMSTGELVGQNGWAGFFASRPNSVIVTNTDPVSSPNHARMIAKDTTPAGQHAYKNFNGSTNYSNVWASAKFEMTDLSTGNGIVMGFGQFSNGNGSRAFMTARKDADGIHWNIGVTHTPWDFSSSWVTWSTQQLNVGELYVVALNYVSGTKVDLYLNPADTSASPLATIAASSFAVSGFGLMGERTFNDSHGRWGNGNVDDVMTGTTFADVFQTLPPIPEPASLGLLTVGGLMMLVRRRNA